MKLLLDTHMLLWAAAGIVPPKALPLLTSGDNTLYYSAASIWEIVIKKSLGRNDFQVEPEVLRRGLADAGYQELAISAGHALAIGDLPPHHKDPFDRILLAQAKSEGMPLLTSDSQLQVYTVPMIFIA